MTITERGADVYHPHHLPDHDGVPLGTREPCPMSTLFHTHPMPLVASGVSSMKDALRMLLTYNTQGGEMKMKKMTDTGPETKLSKLVSKQFHVIMV